MHRSITLAVPFVLLAACSGTDPSESLASSQEELIKSGAIGGGGTTVSPPTDSGVADTRADTSKPPLDMIPLPGTLVLPASPSAPCAPVRYDIRMSEGRTCWDLAKTTSSGTWSVAPVFGDAPAAIRNTICAAIWIASSPACAYPDIGALGLTCKEEMWMTRRSAACAANPAECAVAVSTASASAMTVPPVRTCGGGPGSDSGVIFGGIIGGCDSCGVFSGTTLYLTNPFSYSTIHTNVWTGSGYLSVTMPSHSTTALTGYSGSNVVVWY